MKRKWIDAYLDVADRFAQLSSATKLKVGAVVVKDHRIISIGYNGTPTGWDNECEYLVPEEVDLESRTITPAYVTTKQEVIHAEANAIVKLARSTEAGEGASLFCTHAPCIDCAKLIYGSGISTVVFRNHYRNWAGILFLQKCGVEIYHHS